jgi:uncharacterized protein (TIGR02391 family)
MTPSNLQRFEVIARAMRQVLPREPEPFLHPFDTRNIHPGLPPKVKTLFDDGYYAESTFEAFKYLDKKVEKHSGVSETGFKLMMAAFEEKNPKVKLTPLKTQSEKDEQEGYRFIFAGGVKAIRNPRGHEHSVKDDPDICLDHLSFVSLLLRRLEQAGYK